MGNEIAHILLISRYWEGYWFYATNPSAVRSKRRTTDRRQPIQPIGLIR
jgi:hypothetical protein